MRLADRRFWKHRLPIIGITVALGTLSLISVISFQSIEEFQPSANLTIDALPASWGDRALVYQIWMNLPSNAFKYSQTKEIPQVQLKGWGQDRETIYPVADTDVGFDMQYYKKLFDVFQRLHAAGEFPGTGVGLAIVQRIVARQGYWVGANSYIGKPVDIDDFDRVVSDAGLYWMIMNKLPG